MGRGQKHFGTIFALIKNLLRTVGQIPDLPSPGFVQNRRVLVDGHRFGVRQPIIVLLIKRVFLNRGLRFVDEDDFGAFDHGNGFLDHDGDFTVNFVTGAGFRAPALPGVGRIGFLLKLQ